jgi:histidinol dehydrogenase
VGASPFTYTNQSQSVELLYVSQPAGVTGTFAKNGVALAALTTPAATVMTIPVLLGPGQAFTYTYNAGAPTMARDVL